MNSFCWWPGRRRIKFTPEQYLQALHNAWAEGGQAPADALSPYEKARSPAN